MQWGRHGVSTEMVQGFYLEREPKIFKHLKKSYLLIGAFDQLALLFTLKSLSHAWI